MEGYGPFDDEGYPILTELSKDELVWGGYRFVRNGHGRFDEYKGGELIIGGSVGFPDRESIEQRFHDCRSMMERHEAWRR